MTSNIKNTDINNILEHVLSENSPTVSKKPFEKPTLEVVFFELSSNILSLSGGDSTQSEEYWSDPENNFEEIN